MTSSGVIRFVLYPFQFPWKSKDTLSSQGDEQNKALQLIRGKLAGEDSGCIEDFDRSAPILLSLSQMATSYSTNTGSESKTTIPFARFFINS